MAISIKDIRIGSKVLVRPCFGMGTPVEVIVTELHDNVKNNTNGISYLDEVSDSHWAYLDQVDSVITY